MRKLLVVILFVAACACPQTAAKTPVAPAEAIACDTDFCGEPAPAASATAPCENPSGCVDQKPAPASAPSGPVNAAPAPITLPPLGCDNPNGCVDQQPVKCENPNGCV